MHKGDFGKRLRAIIPGIKDVQSGWFIDGHGPNATRSRSTRYTFPPLSQCRRAFEAHAGQKVPWSNDLEDWQDGRTRDPCLNPKPPKWAIWATWLLCPSPALVAAAPKCRLLRLY